MVKLGDSHNFNRFVYLDSNKNVIKPRDCFFEWLFLCLESPLRAWLEINYLRGPISLLPALTYQKISTQKTKVTYLDLRSPGPNSIQEEDMYEVGRIIALCTFFGMTDLHRENVALGFNEKGELNFGPLDIECLFDEYELVSQTRLLPTRDLALEDSGLSGLHFYLKEYPNPRNNLNLVLGYCEGLGDLVSKKLEITKLISESVDLLGKKIRMVIRPTREYYRYLSSGDVQVIPGEKVQLDRNDIPYFFRILGKGDDIFYYSEENMNAQSKVNLPDDLRNDVFSNYTDIPQLLKHDSVESLMEQGALQICRFADFGGSSYTGSLNGLKLEYKENEIILEFKSEFIISCERKTELKYVTK